MQTLPQLTAHIKTTAQGGLIVPRLKPEQPKRLAAKLKKIRLDLGLSQNQMFVELQKHLKPGVRLHFGYLTLYESGTRTPSILVLLAYSKLANISINVLADDDTELSEVFRRL